MGPFCEDKPFTNLESFRPLWFYLHFLQGDMDLVCFLPLGCSWKVRMHFSDTEGRSATATLTCLVDLKWATKMSKTLTHKTSFSCVLVETEVYVAAVWIWWVNMPLQDKVIFVNNPKCARWRHQACAPSAVNHHISGTWVHCLEHWHAEVTPGQAN